ncbi:MAG: twin-arginine translocase TatA/TatE family subunit [Lentisphaerae bacterium]|nr:twin-arginine translocase TatA/TatE family subunit [Lentisphaerota bacterium]
MFSGPWEIILVLLVILLLFGSKRLPDLARSLGRSLGEFKKGREEGTKPDQPKLNTDGDGTAKKNS